MGKIFTKFTIILDAIARNTFLYIRICDLDIVIDELFQNNTRIR